MSQDKKVRQPQSKKMKRQAKSGDLVYIPSEVVLISWQDGVAEEYVKLIEPKNLLVTRVNSDTYEVFFEDQHWLVDKNKVYGVLK